MQCQHRCFVGWTGVPLRGAAPPPAGLLPTGPAAVTCRRPRSRNGPQKCDDRSGPAAGPTDSHQLGGAAGARRASGPLKLGDAFAFGQEARPRAPAASRRAYEPSRRFPAAVDALLRYGGIALVQRPHRPAIHSRWRAASACSGEARRAGLCGAAEVCCSRSVTVLGYGGGVGHCTSCGRSPADNDDRWALPQFGSASSAAESDLASPRADAVKARVLALFSDLGGTARRKRSCCTIRTRCSWFGPGSYCPASAARRAAPGLIALPRCPASAGVSAKIAHHGGAQARPLMAALIADPRLAPGFRRASCTVSGHDPPGVSGGHGRRHRGVRFSAGRMGARSRC